MFKPTHKNRFVSPPQSEKSELETSKPAPDGRKDAVKAASDALILSFKSIYEQLEKLDQDSKDISNDQKKLKSIWGRFHGVMESFAFFVNSAVNLRRNDKDNPRLDDIAKEITAIDDKANALGKFLGDYSEQLGFHRLKTTAGKPLKDPDDPSYYAIRIRSSAADAKYEMKAAGLIK